MPAKTANTTTKASSIYADEIDLRLIFGTLWKSRRLIVIATLAVAILTFSVSYWILPRSYESTAYVFIGAPVVDFVEAADFSGFKISPTLPDIKAVVKLAAAPGLLQSVIKDPSVIAALGDDEITLSDMTESMTVASDLGKDQISLQVTDTDPQRAALLANTWAEKVTETVNATYGLGAIAQALDSQVLQSQQEYLQAQTALEDALSKSQVNALGAQVESKNTELTQALGILIATQRVLDDLEFFEQGLIGMAGETPLSLGDSLALTTLRQRSLTAGTQTFTLQIDSASFDGVTVSKALESITQMRDGLQTQLTRLQSDQSRLEQEIPQLRKDLDKASNQLSQISLKRNRSLDLYGDLQEQQQRVATVLKQSSKVATVSVGAVPPDKKSSPKVVINTVAAGMLGLMLSIFGVLVGDWYRKDAEKNSRP